jgi:hypothetical protein
MPDSSSPAVDVTNNKAALRYEAHVDGELAGFTTYQLHGDRVAFNHAEVFARWEGQGVGGKLARGALDDAIAHGKQITPLCPFIVRFVQRNPSYLEHVDPEHRHALEAKPAS